MNIEELNITTVFFVIFISTVIALIAMYLRIKYQKTKIIYINKKEIYEVEIELSPRAFNKMAIAMKETEAQGLMYGDTVQLNFKENNKIIFIIK